MINKLKRDLEDEEWEAEAQTSFSLAAESEFARLKYNLKLKASLIRLPWYLRVYNQLKQLFRRILR